MTAVPSTSLRRVMLGLIPVTLGVQACSFASSIALARVLGANTSTDAYFLGLSVPVLVYAILLAAVRLGAIPALTEVAGAGEASLNRASSELVSGVLVASAVLSLLVTGIAVVALPIVLGGSAELISTTRLTVVELAPLGVLGAMTGALGAVLAVRRVFAPQVAVMALEPLIKTALTLTLGRSIGTQALILGNLIGSALAMTVLWKLVRRRGIALGFARPRDAVFVRAVVVLSVPLFVSQSVLQINPLVDRAMVSGLGSGSVTALELGLRLFVVPTGLLTGMLIGPIAATWAAREASGGWPLLRDSLSGLITAVLAVIPPVVVLGIVLRHQLVALMYQGGAYSPHALRQTTSVFGMLLLGLPAQMLGIAFATLFIVKKDAIFPMKIGLANAVLNVVLNFALRPFLGVAGIALSTSLTFTTLVAVYAVAAHRRWRTFSVQEAWAPLMRMATSALIVAAAAVGLVSALPAATSRPRALLVVAVVGAVGLTLHSIVLLVGRDRSAVLVASRFLRLPSRASA